MPRVRLHCRICGRLDGVLMDWGVVAGPQLGAGRNWCTINIRVHSHILLDSSTISIVASCVML